MKFREFIKENTETIAMPTKILGYKQDYIIIYHGSIIEIVDKDGEFIELDNKNPIYKSLKKIFDKVDNISYEEYKEEYEYEHKKAYDKSDWDADRVISEDPKNGLDKILKLIKIKD